MSEKAQGEQNYKGMAIVGEPGPPFVTFPNDAQIFPSSHLQQQEMLWEIVQVVAEGDFMYSDEGVDDIPYIYYCPFPHCDGALSREERMNCEPLQHSSTCIVTKAQQLIEQRKAQPPIGPVHVKITMDGGGYCNAPHPKEGE